MGNFEKKIDRNMIIGLVDKIVSRKRIEFSISVIFKHYLTSLIPCCRRGCLFRDKKAQTEERILTRGNTKLQKFLDVGKLMKAVNLSSILLATLLTQEQRLLLMFQRSQVIEEATADNDSSSDDKDVTHAFHSKLSSKDPFDRIFALGKVTQTLKRFENMVPNSMDAKLLQGFHFRSLDKYAYLARQMNTRVSVGQIQSNRKSNRMINPGGNNLFSLSNVPQSLDAKTKPGNLHTQKVTNIHQDVSMGASRNTSSSALNDEINRSRYLSR